MRNALWIGGAQWAGKSTGEPQHESPDDVWIHQTPQDLAENTLAGFPVRFEWALDDLRALVSGRPILAEGWGLPPELVAPIIDSTRRMIVMVPTQEFRGHRRRPLLPYLGETSGVKPTDTRPQRR